MSDALSTPTSRDLTENDLRHFATFSGLESAAPGRSSRLLLFQLCAGILAGGLGWDPPKIVAEVKSLEGVGPRLGTRSASQFKHPPLIGLWKKHYLTGSRAAFAKNIRSGLGRKGLRDIIAKHHNPTTAHLDPHEISRRIANEAVHGTYAALKQSQSITGEWLIFSRHKNQNYYLTVASHAEPDAEIYARIEAACFVEFPFLRGP